MRSATRRERIERRHAKRLDWAESRDNKAAGALNRAHAATSGIPLGQPILVGHHSERRHRNAIKRSDRAMDAVVESLEMAQRHRDVAASLQTALDRSVFSDDPDAREALEARITEREAAVVRIKAYNASCRAAVKAGRKLGDTSLLDDRQRHDLEACARAGQLREGGAFPGYATTNLAANIRRDRERLAGLAPATVEATHA